MTEDYIDLQKQLIKAASAFPAEIIATMESEHDPAVGKRNMMHCRRTSRILESVIRGTIAWVETFYRVAKDEELLKTVSMENEFINMDFIW